MESKVRQCRLKNISLDLSTRPDLIAWVLSNIAIIEELNTEITSYPQHFNPKNEFINLSINSVYTEFDTRIMLVGHTVFIDCIVGGVNEYYDIEELVILLLPYLTAGEIHFEYYDEFKYLDVELARKYHNKLKINNLLEYATNYSDDIKLESMNHSQIFYGD